MENKKYIVVCSGFWANDDGLNDSNWDIFCGDVLVGSFGIVGYPGPHNFGGEYATKEEVEKAYELFEVRWA